MLKKPRVRFPFTTGLQHVQRGDPSPDPTSFTSLHTPSASAVVCAVCRVCVRVPDSVLNVTPTLHSLIHTTSCI
eukprot:5758384-Prymnesium_polylepis.1